MTQINPIAQFEAERFQRVNSQGDDQFLLELSRAWMQATSGRQYPYNFSSWGRPIIQYPQDIVAVQELVAQVKPDLIIETGIAHGGSLVLSASLLAQLDLIEAIEERRTYNPAETKRKVLAVDIDIRDHNREAIKSHAFSGWIEMIHGSSIDKKIATQVKEVSAEYERVMVFLDSDHTHEHVLEELKLYAPLVTDQSYCVVFDTFIEDLPQRQLDNRPWGPGNNPMTAVFEYLKSDASFEIDDSWNKKLLLTVARNGFLRKR